MNDEMYRCSYCGHRKSLARHYLNGIVVCRSCVDRHNEESDKQYYQTVGKQMMAQSIGHLLISGVIDAYSRCGDGHAFALGAMIASNTRMAIEVMAKERMKNTRDSDAGDKSEGVENARDSVDC